MILYMTLISSCLAGDGLKVLFVKMLAVNYWYIIDFLNSIRNLERFHLKLRIIVFLVE